MLTDGWRRTVEQANSDPNWDLWDMAIKQEVRDYQSRLGLAADWRVFKAQVWTESGAANRAWKTRPMQIGNPGDAGYATMRGHKEYADAIMSPQLSADLDKGRTINDPVFNIQVGLAYAYMKLSSYGSVIADKTIQSYTVKSGDSLERIARNIGTTQKNLLDLNPSAFKYLHPGQKLSYQTSSIKPVSCTVSAATLAKGYNGGGDGDYAEKISYCLQIILNLKR